MSDDAFAELVFQCPDEDLGYIRELLAFDVQCPTSCVFVRDPSTGGLAFLVPPGPLHWSRQVEWPWILKNGEFGIHHRILDVGSGWSTLKYALATRVDRVDALESDQNAIEKAQKTTDLFGFHNIRYCWGDARNLPYEPNTFDRVVLCSVVEHVDCDRHLCVEEAIRVLKPGGILLMTMDVVVDGKAGSGNNFYVDQDEALSILSRLGIHEVISPGGNVTAGARMPEGVIIIVVAVKYTKPKETLLERNHNTYPARREVEPPDLYGW